MSRPREFDTQQALDRAMHLFWYQGFHAATTRDLVREMGLGQQSIYNAFGDKMSLYRRVLTHYEETLLNPRLQDLDKPGASKKELVRFLAQTVEFLDEQSPRKGCFVANAAVNSCFMDETTLRTVQAVLARVRKDFEAAITYAFDQNEFSQKLNASSISESLLCTTIGMSVASRVGARREQLVDMASAALRPLYD